MRSDVLLRRLQSLDIELTPCGDELHFNAPKGALTPELLQEMKTHKQELLAMLRYGIPTARLYPYLGKAVKVPSGEGILWQVFADRVGVVIGGKVRFYKQEEINQ
ncbi:MAG: hypothetical protein HPY52_07830 [Firmicutes bacterium]|nr:hypothetical protein [Bacillota bacterium]